MICPRSHRWEVAELMDEPRPIVLQNSCSERSCPVTFCPSGMINFQMWYPDSCKTTVHLLWDLVASPGALPWSFFPWSPGWRGHSRIMKEINSHWRNRCWSASVPVSAHCAEREAQVTPRYGWYFLPGSPTGGVCGTCGQGHFWRLDTQGFLCNMLVDLSL